MPKVRSVLDEGKLVREKVRAGFSRAKMQRLSYHDNFSAGILTLGKRYFQIACSALLCEDLGPSSAVSFWSHEDYRREKTEVSTEGRREKCNHVTHLLFRVCRGSVSDLINFPRPLFFRKIEPHSE